MFILEVGESIWGFLSSFSWKEGFVFLTGMIAGIKTRSRWKKTLLLKGWRATRKMMIGR